MPRPFRWGVVQALHGELALIDSRGRLPTDTDSDGVAARDPETGEGRPTADGTDVRWGKIVDGVWELDPMFPTIQFCEFWIDQPFRLTRGGVDEDYGSPHPQLLINDDIAASPIIGADTLARNVVQSPSSRYLDGADLGPFGNDAGHVEWPMIFQMTPPETISDVATCEALFRELACVQKALSKVRRDKGNILGFGNRYPCVMNVEWGRGYVRKDERTGEAFALLRVTLTVMENYENPWVD